MRSLHILFFLSPLSLVAADGCFTSNPFGANCDNSAPAIAIDGAQAICNFVLTTCPGGFPGSEVCVTKWCETGCADPDKCCASSNPTSCFQSSSGGPIATGGPSATGDGSPSPVQGPGFAECSSIADSVNYCKSATPEFTTLPNTAQASCFCFNKDGSYNGTAWDYAASTCYAAMATQTSYPASELSVYSADVVGACTKFVDAGVLSKWGVSKGGAVATAAPAGSASPSSSSTATETIIASPEPTEATTSPTSSTVFVSSGESGATMSSEGCGILLGAVLGVSCLFASL